MAAGIPAHDRYEPLMTRLKNRIRIDENGCWIWTGLCFYDGYGKSHWSDSPEQKAHRLSWFLHTGQLAGESHICHHCDVPSCVNPDHLFIGDQRLNSLDAARKGRVHGMKLTADDVRAIRASTEPQTVLAARYGVRQQTISNVKTGKFYGYVS